MFPTICSCTIITEIIGYFIEIKHANFDLKKDVNTKIYYNSTYCILEDLEKMLQVCRVCLAMNTKMFKMLDCDNLMDYFQQISGITVEDVRLPNVLCWECIHRLKNCYRFRHKCQTSHNILIDILKYNKQLTEKSILNIDKSIYNLTSDLTVKEFDNNHSDVYINDTDIIKHDIESCNFNDENELSNDNCEVLPIQEISVDDFNLDFNREESNSSDEVLAIIKNKKSVKLPKKTKIDRRKKPAHEVVNENLFVITDLNLEEQIEEILKRKESLNFKNSTFKCLKCFKGFLDEEAYNSHVVRHTDQCGVHECEVCKIHFKHMRALRNHSTSHRQKFTCRCCPYVTTRRHAVKLHEEWHNGTKYRCPHCHEEFLKFSTYMGHIRIKHPSDFVCQLCGHSYVSEKGLALHKKLKHRFQQQNIPEDGPACVDCNVTFTSTEAYEKHMNISTKHNHIATKDSGKARRHKSKDNTLNRDRKPNSKPEGPIPCEQCSLNLPDSLSYYRHFRRMHPDKNRTNYPSMKSKCMCEVCGKMFQSLALLQDHSWTHLATASFRCTECDKTFQRKYRLIAHSRLHRREKQTYACQLCSKVFSTSSNRQRHMFSHTGLKPFKCELCGKSFKHASEKRAHITYVHLKKPWPKRTRHNKHKQPHPDSLANTNTADISQPMWSENKNAQQKVIFYN